MAYSDFRVLLHLHLGGEGGTHEFVLSEFDVRECGEDRLGGLKVAELKARIGQDSRVNRPADDIRLRFSGRILQDDLMLRNYLLPNRATVEVLFRQPVLFRADLADPPNADTDSALSKAWRTRRQEMFWRALERFANHAKDECDELKLVHLWRVGSTLEWAELIIEGPPGSAYEGGAFLMRLALSDNPTTIAMRMLTPIYHPCIGPSGSVAVICWYPGEWSMKSLPDAIKHFVDQLRTHTFREVADAFRDHHEHQAVLAAWSARGEARAREEARRWTLAYATNGGRSCLRQSQACTTLQQLAMLMAHSPQLRDEVRATLLCARRGACIVDEGDEGGIESVKEEGSGLGRLPTELLLQILFFVASYRMKPPSGRWMASSDDGLPFGWRDRLFKMPRS